MYKADYWNEQYGAKRPGWDAGSVSIPIKEYFEQIEDKNMRILVPGAGNAYEVEYLHAAGFQQVFLMEIAEQPIRNFLSRVPDFPREHILREDFFQAQGQYDRIVELAFISSFRADERQAYVQKMHELLALKGKLIGLVFNHHFHLDHPPYGGTEQEYDALFRPFFDFDALPVAHNSIKPRAGREIFLKLEKRGL